MELTPQEIHLFGNNNTKAIDFIIGDFPLITTADFLTDRQLPAWCPTSIEDIFTSMFTWVTLPFSLHQQNFIIKNTKTGCLALLQVLHTKRHMKQPSTLTRDNKFSNRKKYIEHKSY